ncbi:ABC transporter related protein [Kribbella flavida DSM 17836]|uniref:ABC transporter related protein n=1 Tax=Kribbella flavida (strain DSM 17836 / JCM 10339 / NBRC 14399) TaxID=479435 RepID=D2Q0W6_KRIFD|nr:ABC transporter ATP-binding protein [Kribbella flavida]ADB35667.1 ABC transporter related protein [Kribbella flavida DSM 17836]
MTSTPALELTDLEYAYHRNVALRGITVTVAPGEVVAITGASGCGKSTLLHCAAGILTPDAGTVAVAGQDLAALPEEQRSRMRRTHIGVVLQFGQLVPDLSLADNVALPLLLDGADRAGARRSAVEWLDRVGIADEADAVPAQLSGGQTQRAAIARALVTGPSVVLADEPTGSVDSRAGQELLKVLLRSTRDRGAALVMVTHDNLLAASADREIRLRDGKIQHEVTLR